jgi:CBS domain-containing protein
MAQTGHSDANPAASSARTDRIEKGWTVYDAVEHPVGNVTDVDRNGSRLLIDGRSVGFEDFDVPLNAVRDAGDNEVQLTLTVDTNRRADGGRPRFTDGIDYPPSPSRTAQPGVTATSSTSRFADAAPADPAPLWTEDENSRGFMSWLPYIGLVAAAGLSAAGYYWWHQRQRKASWDRARDFIGERHPAWWAGLVAALPLAYSVWPSKTAPTKALPIGRQSSWTDSLVEHARSSGTALGVGLPLAVLAAAGVALYAAIRGKRETTMSPLSEIMTRHPEVIRPDTTVAEAAALLRSLNVGALPVCAGSRLVGMVTDRDITLRAVAEGRDARLTPVRAVMSSDITWASETDPVEQAIQLMKERQIRRLPIVDQRQNLVGIISLGDLATNAGHDRLSGETLERISEPARPSR